MTAGPQLEDGFTRISNDLFEAILGFGFTHREVMVLLTIVRKTYGYGKKADDISASQISAMCGIARQHVTSTLNSLALRNVISKSQGRFGSMIGMQKNSKKWIGQDRIKAVSTSPDLGQGCPESGQVNDADFTDLDSPKLGHPCPDLGHVPICISTSPDLGQVDSPKSGHTKENLPKENQQKKRRASRLEVCFGDWLAKVKEDGGKPIPEDHEVFSYAKQIALPIDYVRLCWQEFQLDHADNCDKKQKDWPRTFSNYVRKNYLRLWYDKDGIWQLTTRGKQAERDRQAKHPSAAPGDPEPGPRPSEYCDLRNGVWVDRRFAGSK